MIGILYDNIIRDSRTYHLFKNLNELAKKYSCYLFTNRIHQFPIEPNFPILQQIEAMSHGGILISTSILNTQILANVLTCKRKIFYMYNIELLTLDKFNTNQLTKIFYNDDIDLLIRDDGYREYCIKMFKEPLQDTLLNWDYRALEKIYHDTVF